MTYQTITFIILITWAVLLTIYFLGRDNLRNRYLKNTVIIHSADANVPIASPGTSRSKIGSLVVFGSNIATFGLIFIAALSPELSQRLTWVSVGLPPWLNVFGSILFVLNLVWGFLALIFNPNYTPLYQPMKQQFLLATRGPYAVLRHPRYAVEIWQNLILFIFTGFWTSLLGALGWIAMYNQAREEERHLMTLAGEAYGKYRQHTGMFLPKLSGGS
jgi:protein-S-isoprenylcysteine O-methyltransferase Ste14